MEYILLFMLVSLELGFFIWSVVTKESHKFEKSVANISFAGLYVIGLVTGLIMWGFRYFVITIVILVKVILSIVTIVKNKKFEFKLFRSIRKFMLNVLVIVFSLISAFAFPQYDMISVTGTYKVETAKYTWIDETRMESYQNNEINRALTVEFWFPSELSNEYPLVVFSHGAFGYNGSNYSTFMELASNGYVVASIGHTYQAFFTEDTSGNLTIVDQGFLQQAIDINAKTDTRNDKEVFEITQSWMDLRVADENFVIDKIIELTNLNESDKLFDAIDTSRIGAFGHSLGGASSAQIGRLREDIDAVIVLDGTMLGEEIDFQNNSVILNTIPYPVPLFNIYAEDHYTNAMTYVGTGYNNFYASKNAFTAYETVIKGAGHLNFTDLPLFSPFLASALGVGSIDGRACIEKTNELVLMFFDYYLKDLGELTIQKEY